MIAKPNTELRSLAISALASKGYAGPNYNLDDVAATITKINNSFHVDFWDMNCTVDENHKLYNRFVEEYDAYEKHHINFSEKFIAKINNFATLEKNWNEYDGNPVSKISIISAIEVVNYLYDINKLSDNIDIYPMGDGGIQFEFNLDHYSELEIEPKGRMTYSIFDKDYTILNQKTSNNINDLIK